MKTPIQEAKESMKVVELHPSLEEVVNAGGLNRTKLSVALRVQNDRPDLSAREEVSIYDGTKGAIWKVPSLGALFRGDKPAPSMPNEPPPAYMPLFFFIELHVLTFCEGLGDKTDGEFEEVYSNLRRRPDGKSLSELHFFLWQVAVCLVGKRPVSAAEFEAIFGRLERSARTFGMGPVSRNYIGALRQMNQQMTRR